MRRGGGAITLTLNPLLLPPVCVEDKDCNISPHSAAAILFILTLFFFWERNQKPIMKFTDVPRKKNMNIYIHYIYTEIIDLLIFLLLDMSFIT